MRLTLPLQKTSLKDLINKVRRTKSVVKVADNFIPSYVQKAGIVISDPVEEFKPKPRFPPWEPPVKDDPRFSDLLPNENLDDNKKMVYKFVELSHLVEGMRQAELLTKTHVINGLPDKITKNIGVVRLPRQDELVKRYIMQANVWNTTKVRIKRWRLPETPRGWKFKSELGIPKSKTNQMLLQNVIRLCQTLNPSIPELSDLRRLTTDHKINAIYQYKDDKHVNIEAYHKYMLSSKKPLTPFASQEEVNKTADFPLLDLFPIEATIDLRTSNEFIDEQNRGWLPEVGLFPHTIYHSHRDHWKINNKNAKALMFAFGNCVTVAKEKYGPDVKVLPEPISVQWIGADEDTFHFMCFQLNTLDTSSLDGIKNMLWVDSSNKMYDKVLPKRAMLRNTVYKDYDPEVFAKILAFYITDVDLDLMNNNFKKKLLISGV